MAKVSRMRVKNIPKDKVAKQMTKFIHSNQTKIHSDEIDLQNYRCPCCKKRMHIEELSYENNEMQYWILKCDDCKLKGKARREKNNKIYLSSTPANQETRYLRQEAHYYFGKLSQEGIFTTTEAYVWLSSQIYEYDMGIHHIGEFNDYFCKKTIEISMKCIIANKHKIKKDFKPYTSKKGKSYTETSSIMKELWDEYYAK